MPITYGNVPWPPPECADPAPYYQEWGAWYRGDLGGLAAVYGGARRSPAAQQFFGSDTGTGRWPGAKNLISTFWHGKMPTPGQNTTRLHIPAAADVSKLSASMLYAEPPAFTVPNDEAARDRLEEILKKGGIYSVLQEQAEQASAFGGMFLRASVDVEISDTPLVDALIPDNAVPVWRRGILVAVTFWRKVHEDGAKIWRHLERHDVERGVGYVEHALYLGGYDKLGEKVPLEDGDDECQYLAQLVDSANRIPTGATKLDVVYQPNIRPHRLIRGTPLGRSDYQGAEGAMDGLDETWSSWMRDIRLAKGRMVVPQAYLMSGGAGGGAYFDLEQEVFQGINMMGGKDQGMQLSQVQFAIRVEEHERTCAGHWRTISQTAGLSRDAFGESEGGGERTAKEVGKHGERSTGTKQQKQGYQTPGLSRLAFVIQELDVAHLGGKYTPSPVEIEWPDNATVDPETQARTLQLLDAAKAVSTRTKVEMLHPDWDSEDIDAEIILIEGPKIEEPDLFGQDPGNPGDPVPFEDGDSTQPPEPAGTYGTA